MKNKVGYIYLSAIVMLTLFSFMPPQIDKDYQGRWSFKAPEAPEGSTNGNIEITPSTVIMTFDNVVGFKSNWAKMKSDSIIYETSFDLATVVFMLKVVDDEHIEGKAVWKDGESPVFLTKTIVGVRL
ncbi:MAG TPA: hypothetical protein VK213_14690 [Bacteroidales bacterium]|nr:hypothetical protein [Bacteroidales bacterium]